MNALNRRGAEDTEEDKGVVLVTDIDRIRRSLLSKTHLVAHATRPTTENGLPDGPGIYAWWVLRGALGNIPAKSHPTESHRQLLYVGIAPKRSASSATIRSRVISNHLRGNTGSSTFRLALAATLIDALCLHPNCSKSGKCVLPSDENQRLSTWQKDHLSITWAIVDQPWDIEAHTIQQLKPLLNVCENNQHPYYSVIRANRARFRQLARS